jgi:hypothetical protein
VDLLSELGYSEDDISSLLADGVAVQSTLRQERAL